MDNVKKISKCINIPLSQHFSSYLHKSHITVELYENGTLAKCSVTAVLQEA
jgi:hypothetical protein